MNCSRTHRVGGQSQIEQNPELIHFLFQHNVNSIGQDQVYRGTTRQLCFQSVVLFLSSFLPSFFFFFFFSYFSFLAAPWHTEFQGQGSDLHHSCDPPHSSATPEHLTYSAQLGVEPVFWHCRDTADPGVPQRGALFFFFSTGQTLYKTG